MKKRRAISDGAFPQAEPKPDGNFEQRRAWRAIQRRRDKERRRAMAKEMKKLPPKVRALIRGTKELNESIRRKEREES